MEALRCGYEAQLATLRQGSDDEVKTVGMECHEVEARHEEEQQWLDTQHRTEMDEVMQHVDDEHCCAEERMLAEQ